MAAVVDGGGRGAYLRAAGRSDVRVQLLVLVLQLGQAVDALLGRHLLGDHLQPLWVQLGVHALHLRASTTL